jgi:hypothetical protein
VRCFLIAAKSDMYNNDVGKGGKRGEYMLMKLMKKKKLLGVYMVPTSFFYMYILLAP